MTSSTGNHGQGVAFAARALGVPCDIFLADNPNPMKRAMIELLGATTHIGGDVIEAKLRAKSFCASVSGMFVDDGESIDVIEGAGTIGLEIANTLADVDFVLVPMGSGSLVSGVAVALKAAQRNARVIAVQPEDSPAMTHSFHARKAVQRPGTSIADCLACRLPAATALNALLTHVDDAILVSDTMLLSAVRTLLTDAHMLAEPGAVAGLAGAYKLRSKLRGKRVVIVVTGANITTEHLKRALDSSSLFDA